MKKLSIALLSIILCISLFSGCAPRSKEAGNKVNHGPYIAIEDWEGDYYDGLVYHEDTKVIYIYTESYRSLAVTNYISEKGNFCRYVDGAIKEIK